jgi:hypothetical protein
MGTVARVTEISATAEQSLEVAIAAGIKRYASSDRHGSRSNR